MTVSSTTRKAGPYDGNDLTTAFPFDFKVFANTDVQVISTSAAGVETVKTLTTDYTVALNADQDSNPGGTVTMLTAPATGTTLTMLSQVSFQQPDDITDGGAFYPGVVESGLDRAIILAQQLLETVDRSIKIPASYAGGANLQLPTPVANKILGWDSSGLNLKNFDLSTSGEAKNILANDGASETLWSTVQEFIDSSTINLTDYAALRTYAGPVKQFNITGLLATAQPQGITGVFADDETDTTSGAVFTGSISGNTLTVSAVTSGALAIGQAVNRGDTGATVGYITAGSGTSWTISGAGATIGSMVMTADNACTYIVSANGQRLKRQYDGRNVFTSWADQIGSDNTFQIQTSVNTSAARIIVVGTNTVSSEIDLVANQTVDLTSGEIIASASGTFTNGILYGNGKSNIRIIDPTIDASATAGVGGISFVDCPGSKVIDGQLTKCNLNFQSSVAATRMGYKASGTVIDMAGWAATSCYVSAAKGVLLMGLEMFNGKEGIGIYNGASMVRRIACESYGHTQDGLITVAGTKVVDIGNLSHTNGQSGIVTQRYNAGTDTQDLSAIGNICTNNAYDGLDLRGATTTPWGVDMRLSAVGNVLTENAGTGSYIVNNEGVLLLGNVTANNSLQGVFSNLSSRVGVIGHLGISDANGVSTGTSKAGVLFQDSVSPIAVGVISTNSNGATQEYGVSFTGTTGNGILASSWLNNNSVAPFYSGAAYNLAYVQGCVADMVGNVWANNFTANTGASDETGFGVPTHTRSKGSVFRRTDGGSAEVYYSQGGGTWTQLIIP